MKLKKFLLLLPLVAVGLVGCDTRDVDPTPEPVEPDPTDPDPVTPTDPDPDNPEPDDPEPGDEEPVEEVDYHARAIENLKGLKNIGIEGLYTVASIYDAGTENEWVYSYSCDCAGIYTEEYIWAYHMYNSTGREFNTVYVNHEGLCATGTLNRQNKVDYEYLTDNSGGNVNFADKYYQPFTYLSKDNTTWDDDTLTLSIDATNAEDELVLFGELFIDDLYYPDAIDIVFDSNINPTTLSIFEEYQASESELVRKTYDGKIVDISALEDRVDLPIAYESYDKIEGLEAILEALQNANSYTVQVEGAETLIWGYFNKNQGALQYFYESGYSGTLNVDGKDGYYVTFDGISDGAVNATSGNIEGDACDAYFAAGSSGITPDYDIGAGFFEYEGNDTDGNPIYGIRLELGTTYYPYLLPAYTLIEEAYGSGSFLNEYVNDQLYHLQISGTATRPKMTFSYNSSTYGTIYTDTIVFSNLNNTTIPYTSINYPTTWSRLLGEDIDDLDLILNAQDTSGGLSFDENIPYILWNDNPWTIDYSYLTKTAVDLYLYADDYSTAKAMFNEYSDVIYAKGWTQVDFTTSDTNETITYKNSDNTIGLKLEAQIYTYSGRTYYFLDLYVYGITGDFGKLITNIAGESVVRNNESNYSVSVDVSTISSAFPYVNPTLGYEGYTFVTQSSVYYWAVTYTTVTSYSSVRTYIDELNDVVEPVYASLGWSVENTGSTSLLSYQWTYTDNGTTYSLDVTYSLRSYFYYDICLRFGTITAE